jgi:hypothetical protein
VVLPTEIAQPHGQAIEQEEFAFSAMAFDRIRNSERSLNRAPMRRPVAAMLRDPRLHLGIFGPCRRNVECTPRVRAERLSETALAAACAADNERDHGRGKRASQFCSRDALD